MVWNQLLNLKMCRITQISIGMTVLSIYFLSRPLSNRFRPNSFHSPNDFIHCFSLISHQYFFFFFLFLSAIQPLLTFFFLFASSSSWFPSVSSLWTLSRQSEKARENRKWRELVDEVLLTTFVVHLERSDSRCDQWERERERDSLDSPWSLAALIDERVWGMRRVHGRKVGEGRGNSVQCAWDRHRLHECNGLYFMPFSLDFLKLLRFSQLLQLFLSLFCHICGAHI